MKPQDGDGIALSVIQYRPDLIAPAASNILLGFLIEVKAPAGHLIGLLARESLSTKEKNQLDAIARVQLTDPSKYLARECSKAFASAEGSILDYLSQEHAWALMITEPNRRSLPAKLARLKRPETLIKHTREWLSDETRKAREAVKAPKTKKASPTARKRTTPRHHERASLRAGYSYSVTLQGSQMHI